MCCTLFVFSRSASHGVTRVVWLFCTVLLVTRFPLVGKASRGGFCLSSQLEAETLVVFQVYFVLVLML